MNGGRNLLREIISERDRIHMNYCIYGASSDAIDSSFLRAGEALGRALARRGIGMVFGGGAAGMMGAAARGAHEIGGVDIISVAPSFFNVDGVLFEHCTQMIYTDTMRERKQRMEELSAGFIITPGGVGTMDEFFEIFTLRHLGRHEKPVILFNVNHYYDIIDELLHRMVKEHFMRESSLSMYRMFEDPEELAESICGGSIR